MTERPERFTLTLFTAEPELARVADAAGIDRIGVDIESLDKRLRQPDPNWRVSQHSIADAGTIGGVLTGARLFARTNSVRPGLAAEVEALLAVGVTVLMLPYFRSLDQARAFADIVGGRATTVLLIETPEATGLVAALASLEGIDELHFGLNDLSLAMGVDDRFLLLDHPLLVRAAAEARDAGIDYAIGGISRLDRDDLPTDPRWVCRRIAELGAHGSIVARSFFRPGPDISRTRLDVAGVRAYVAAHRPPAGK